MIPLSPTRPQVPASGFALWQLGFRPFYLLASAFAALSIALWGLQLSGLLPTPYLPGPLWHAHEMLFGFAQAVVVGFLFTAGRNWSQQPTPTGRRLMALAALWLAGRVLVLTPWGWASAVANAAFPLAAAAGLAGALVRGGNRRNYFFVGLLALLAPATLAVHLDRLGVTTLASSNGLRLALDVMLFILCVMGGRVIPMFTNNGVPGVNARRLPWLEKASLGLVLAVLALDGLQAMLPASGVMVTMTGMALTGTTALAGLAHLARWWLWQPWRTLRAPLVWILHLAYAWIPLHLALRAASGVGFVPAALATHALTAGAMGAMIVGMMTRTARGHTARPLRADRWDVTCYLLVAAAGLVRVLPPLLAPALTWPSLMASAALWSAGFAVYALAYWPVLTRARLDGLPG